MIVIQALWWWVVLPFMIIVIFGLLPLMLCINCIYVAYMSVNRIYPSNGKWKDFVWDQETTAYMDEEV